MEDLLQLREEIDKIDNQLVSLYEERMKIAEGVARYKIATGKKVLDRERELSKLETLSAKATTEFTKVGISELFEHIMAVSRKRQYQLLNENGVVEKPSFEVVEDFITPKAKISENTELTYYTYKLESNDRVVERLEEAGKTVSRAGKE